MRILAVTNLYPNPYQPQRAAFNRQQLRGLARRHAVSVIAPIAWTDELAARRAGKGPLPAGRREVVDGIPVTYPRYLYTPRLLRGWYGHFYRWSIARTFRRVVADFCPDLVFASWAYPDGWAAVNLGRRAGLPVVLKVHGSDVLALSGHPARRRGTLEALREADRVVAVSRDLAEQLAEWGVARDRIRVVYNGVDPALFSPGPQAEARARLGLEADLPVLLLVGNLVPVKGPEVLLEACRRLAARGVRFRCHLIGDGPLRAQLESQSAAPELAGRVVFHGGLPHHNLPDWYRAASVLVLPSRSEGVPNVLLEATACGTPFVASRVGGVPEVVCCGDSRLVTPDDPGELAQAIEGVLTAMGPRGEARGTGSAPRGQDESVAELNRLFEEVLGARLTPPARTTPRPLPA